MGNRFGFYTYLSDNPHIGFSEKLKDPTLALFAQLGYKRSILKDKYYWGVALTPLLFDERDWEVYPWAALRFGYQF
ncbi:hypothetical protein [Marinifilum fragile]|uniref:hypothetical protein n=1 Tax=Marinifilum fragile TaxID=570161 RepID=UPI002AA82CF8|nr:hypothetical protein [Marinifilum fragile]